ncbi:glycerophosphodiester phosphodiesterase [Larkinella insperata]|uniref:Glycerophosphodiester phosphodiesterase n=1 Tax=Larkinella insperata TaxID=332158 RepID=A0ABW3QFX5_9BACT|nr:glycerophosphodiester phosphodiesterase family protein [Larkinella insperata]
MRSYFLLLFWAVFQLPAFAQTAISAHRGSSLVAPENTLATFRTVLQWPVSYLEIDVRTTRDGQLVILHDGNLDRTTNGSGPVQNRTLAELKQLSAGKGFGESFNEERIPTLKEVGRLLRDWNQTSTRKVHLYVDCKAVQPQKLVDELAELNLLDDAVFYGSDAFLMALKQAFPRAKLMPSLRSADEMTAKVQQLQPYAFDVRWPSLTAELIQRIHAHGIRVFSDALDFFETPEHYRKAAQMGVDVIQTDFVERVSQALKK